MSDPATFVVDADITSRQTEVASADFVTGMNLSSNACGIGIGIDGGSLEPERDSNWTLLDQDGAARTPQVSQLLGGAGFVDRSSVPYDSSGGAEGKGTNPIREGTNPANVNGQPNNDAPIILGNDADLATLAAGWTAEL